MKIIVDTCVWSAALRRTGFNENNDIVNELKELIHEGRVQMIGPVRQELLSGIKTTEQFDKLRTVLSSFPDLILQTRDYEKAAEFYNKSRKKGIQGSNTDFLICAIAVNHSMPVFTTDNDFKLFKKYIPIKLHIPRT
jgi:predicted nucleic acid-binding protein